jgi:hypothetical protein
MKKEIIDNFSSYLALIIECEEKQDRDIQHEWTFDDKNNAVKVANYLRSHGYKAELSKHKVFHTTFYYVGVPFKTLVKPV